MLFRSNGEKLIDRLIRIFMSNDASEIVVICNDVTTQVSMHLAQLQKDGLKGHPLPLRFIVKSTPSSMHSLYEISKYLDKETFCLTTVDTVFDEEIFSCYLSCLRKLVSDGVADGVMGVTSFIDDEKPLYVDTDDDMNITGFLDKQQNSKFVSGGIYGLTPKSITILQKCIDNGESRMRNFQRALVADRLNLKAFDMGRIMDIDRIEDIRKAEIFMQGK